MKSHRSFHFMGLFWVFALIQTVNAISLQIPTRPTEFPLLVQPYSDSGFVAAWGGNPKTHFQLPSNLTNVVQVADGQGNAAALLDDGSVVQWGDYANYPDFQTHISAAAPVGLSNVIQISLGASHSIALKSDGTVVAWGNNGFGNTDVPLGLSNVVQIAAGVFHTLALKSDGTVVAWGANSSGQATVPPGLSNVVEVAAGGAYSVALKSDGTVVAWGYSLS